MDKITQTYPLRSRPGVMHYGAFSLLELLVVMAIIALLAVTTLPAVQSLLAGSNLSRTGQLVGDQLQLARQEAVTRNREARVLFYNFPDGVNKGWAGMQVFIVEQTDSNAVSVPLGRMQTFPEGVILSSNATLSPLLTAYTSITSTNIASRGTVGVAEFRFRPNGFLAGNITSSNNFITLQNSTAQGNPPANYYTIELNPVTGRAAIFRP